MKRKWGKAGRIRHGSGDWNCEHCGRTGVTPHGCTTRTLTRFLRDLAKEHAACKASTTARAEAPATTTST